MAATVPKDGPGFNPYWSASTAEGLYAPGVRSPPERTREHEPLANRCTFELGGPARWFLDVESDDALREAVRWARDAGVAWVILGGGSNVVVDDRGYDGLVMHMATRGIGVDRDGDTVLVRVAAGESWDGVVARAVERGWAGLECLSGIPGLAGATPIQNVGAYGCEVADTIRAVRVYDPANDSFRDVTPETCAFAYRDSAFKREGSPLSRCIVTHVTFALRVDGPPTVKYPELSRALAARGSSSPTLSDVRSLVIALRREKSMLIDPRDENRRSAGSFFTNVVLSAQGAEELFARAVRSGVVASAQEVPRFDGGAGRVKVPAAWLIERAGFAKGQRAGAFGLSSKHALAIVHHGGGTTNELLAFAERIRDRVREIFGVTLAMEPVRVG